MVEQARSALEAELTALKQDHSGLKVCHFLSFLFLSFSLSLSLLLSDIYISLCVLVGN